MAGRLQLEVFETGAEPSDTLLVEASRIEDMRLDSFEQGYKAGWDDCVAANAAEQSRIGADLARHLQALSFTYHEARGTLLRGLGPLMSDIAAKLLPAIAAQSLAPLIAERLAPALEAAADVPVQILVSPDAEAPVAAAIAGQEALPLMLSADPALGAGQAVLRFGEAEERIDLDATVAAISAALRDHFTPGQKDQPHG